MKTLLYINENKVLKSRDFTDLVGYSKVEIPENFLIVGILENGILKNPHTDNLADYDLKAIEKYLMISSNVDFTILPSEFRLANLPFLFGSIPPPLPQMGSIFIENEWLLVLDFNQDIQNRYGVVNGNFKPTNLTLHFKLPNANWDTLPISQANFVFSADNKLALTMEWYADPETEIFVQFPDGTQFYVSDDLGLYQDTNKVFIMYTDNNV